MSNFSPGGNDLISGQTERQAGSAVSQTRRGFLIDCVLGFWPDASKTCAPTCGTRAM